MKRSGFGSDVWVVFGPNGRVLQPKGWEDPVPSSELAVGPSHSWACSSPLEFRIAEWAVGEYKYRNTDSPGR